MSYMCHVISTSFFFFFSSRRRHTRCSRDWSSDVCSSDLFPYSWSKDRLAQVAQHAGVEVVLINMPAGDPQIGDRGIDRKSTRLNSSHGYISYAVFCLKKKKNTQSNHTTTST